MNKATIRKFLNVLALGGIAALFCTIAGGLALSAVWLFCYIPSTGGYFAVLLFALAVVAAAAALCVTYKCGAWICDTGKYSE